MNSTATQVELPLATDGQILDLAGRQRMLNQSLMKELLAELVGLKEGDYKGTIQLLRQTAVAMAAGGEASLVPGQPPAVTLPPAPTPEIREKLALQPILLDDLEKAAQPLLASQLGDPGLRKAVASFLSSGARLHSAANEVTRMMASHFQAEKEALEKRERDMSAAMREVLSVIAAQSNDLAERSNQLSGASLRMRGHAEETSQQARIVSEASTRIMSIVQSVASATEEMDATIHEIASNASSAAQIAGEAVGVVGETNRAVSRLEKSSLDIGQVVKVINTVAQQTNLLALNATIEAARAGEAGKGFAVVAHEVKELAKETARATGEISQRIEAIQTDTRSAIKAIGQIQTIVDRLNATSTTIATAVEQQSLATKDIARNLTEASTGVSDISSGATGVASVAEQTAAGAAEGLTAASGLARMAAELQKVATGCTS